MWVARQANDPFCLFWRETKQRPQLEIFDETGSGQGNAREELEKEPREGSWRRVTQRGSRQRTVEETSGREIESRGSEEDRQDEFAVLS